jgi:hypothetical protein
MKNRKLFNTAIVRKLQELVEEYPDLRFGQILVNSEIVQVTATSEGVKCQDPFYEEPEIMWERIKNNKFAFKEL